MPFPVREREEKHDNGAVAVDEKGKASLEIIFGWVFSLVLIALVLVWIPVLALLSFESEDISLFWDRNSLLKDAVRARVRISINGFGVSSSCLLDWRVVLDPETISSVGLELLR